MLHGAILRSHKKARRIAPRPFLSSKQTLDLDDASTYRGCQGGALVGERPAWRQDSFQPGNPQRPQGVAMLPAAAVRVRGLQVTCSLAWLPLARTTRRRIRGGLIYPWKLLQ